MKIYQIFLITLFLIGVKSIAQVGIGNTSPKSTLDITASNVATPANTDGILIPRVDAFPAANPTAAQNGMLLFLTTDNKFYYWNWNSGTNTGVWTAIIGIGAEKINDLSDGKSDNDGSDNGSSIYLGIGAGNVDDLSDNKNVGIGFESLKVNTVGTGNIAIGYQSLFSNTNGFQNTAIGNQALYSCDGCANNTANGTFSLFSNINGSNNVANGYEALKNNTDGSNNIAIGMQALFSNRSGYQNLAIGSYAMQYANNSITLFQGANTAVGYEALRGSTTPSDNTGTLNNAFGYASLKSNTSGNENLAFGVQSLTSNTNGSQNVAIGNESLFENTFGDSNVAIGYRSMYFNTNGQRNISIGKESLYHNQTGIVNVALGNNAMYNNFYGDANVAIGSYSLYHNKSGTNSTAIGSEAMYYANNTSTPFYNYNVALGYQSLRGSLTQADNTGNFNTSIGSKVLLLNSSGGKNVAVGFQSLSKNTIGANNTTIGYESGFNNVFGNGSVFLGYQAGYNETTSNKLYIENSNANATNALIYGEFDTNILRVNGELQIGNQTTTGFKFPTTRGTNNQVLKTNASGVLSWADDSIGIDHDFYKVGTTLPPTTINDDMFTNGKLGINKAVPTSSLDLVDARGKTAFNLYLDDTGGLSGASPTYGIKSTIDNTNDALATGITIGISNTIDVLNDGIGIENSITGNLVSTGNLYGTKQILNNSGTGEVYGIYNVLNGDNGGSKYGSYNKVEGLPVSGTNYGLYSESLTGYAGFFLGRVSIGTTNLNNYLLPSTRGTNAQVMQTDGSGNVSWANLPSESLDWKLTGNTGTNASSNFIGTTDNIALSFRTNNTLKMQLTTNGNLKMITATDDEAQIKNGNNFSDAADTNIDFSVNETKDSWMISSREGAVDNSGIYGNRDFITMWSPGDSNRIVRFLDEDDWADSDGDPYNNLAEKSYIDSNGQYVQASDKNRKENFNKIINASEKLNKLHGYTYNYKLNASEKQKGQQAIKTSGIIAQELYQVLPEAVQISESGEYFVHYAGIIPLLIEALKEQQEINKKQQQEINQLKFLEERILKLENK